MIYDRSFAAAGYDLLARLVFAPVGGLSALREEALEVASVRAGMRVLELGCGSGALTRELLARGAAVTAVDRSPAMLARARRRAPAASFVNEDITAFAAAERVERVLFAFVLHELDAPNRRIALERATRALEPDGRLVIVDHALPSAGSVAKAVSAFVHGFEPPSVTGWLRGGMTRELAEVGLVPEIARSLARGTAVALRCRAT
ncbi:MAG: class I SAM-dependent methyltransferase [Labilithrix sp.]|nr:class I SAM-dependent methyltransferase [Labilithrix sp.]